MRAGYGRGYYGGGQLAQSAPRRRSWFTIVAVLGVGAAVVWLLWPRKIAHDYETSKEPALPTPPPPPQLNATNTTGMTSDPVAIGTTSVPFATGAFLKQLEDDARSRGFLSVKDYEDSVIASAKQLQAAGAQVVLAPHLQHLAPQLGS